MDIKEILKQKILNATLEKDIEIELSIPSNKEFGDYSTNIAMKLSSKLNKNPRLIAEEITKKINMDQINKIEIAGPGFINFYLNKEYLIDNINNVLKEDGNYGKSKIGNKERINLEYVSVNPTGTIHPGHARGACYGDSLANILTFAGFDVTREYYVNDAGNQMHNMALSIKERYKELCNLPSNMQENYYYGKEIISVAKTIYDKYEDKFLDHDIDEFQEIGLKFFLNQIKDDLNDLRVTFDVWSSEQKIRDKGLVEEAVDKLNKMGYTYKQENAVYLKTSMFGDEKDRVIIKTDGTYTYFTPDIAYHLDKLSRGFDKLIDVLGADHHGYINRLKAAVTMLGNDPDKLSISLVQLVRAIKDGEEYKISKRTGKTISLRDLLNEVGVDAIRYFFTAKSIDTQMDFDIDLALTKSNENPVFYIEYAHARICSILSNYSKNIDISHKITTIKSESAYNVLEKIYNFKDVVERSAIKKEPHLIANYVYDLSSSFHSYYGKEKIITDSGEETEDRIMLIKATKITIDNALKLIGIIPPDKM